MPGNFFDTNVLIHVASGDAVKADRAEGMAAGAAGIDAYDGAYPDIANLDGYRQDAQAAHQLGFTGKSCIHPSQIALANEVFLPVRAD